MTLPIPLNLAVEDDLSEAVLRETLRQSGRGYFVGSCFSGRGFGYLKKTIRGFNKAARGTPFLVLTDLNRTECPPMLIEQWLPTPKHHNLLFRVAVREVEAWILADGIAFATFLGIPRQVVPANVEEIENAKEFLIDLARRSRRRDLRDDIVPPPGSTRKQGPNYSGRLVSFVEGAWSAVRAQERSPSLRRTLNTLREFEPRWSTFEQTG